MDENPRATKVIHSKDQEEIDEIIDQMHHNKNVNAFFVLSKFIDYNEIKTAPQFCQLLFHQHLEVIIQLIEWMLTPKLVMKKKKLKNNVHTYPYQCKQFMKDNWCFYEQMYISAFNRKFQFQIWFNFLRPQYFDKETIFTSLGYFADVMIPFAKYEFFCSTNLSKSVQLLKPYQMQTISILKLLPKSLTEQLLKYCYYQPIFYFLKTAILVSVEDPKDYQVSKQIAVNIMQKAKFSPLFNEVPAKSESLSKAFEYLENISSSLKQMIVNIDPNNLQFPTRSYAMIDAILESGIIKYSIDEIQGSKYCKPWVKEKEKLHSSLKIQNEQISKTSPILSSSLQINPPQACSEIILPSIGMFLDPDEQEILEILLRIINSSLQIFSKIPKSLLISQDQLLHNHNQNIKNVRHKHVSYKQYSLLIDQFQKQIQYVFNNLEIVSKIVYSDSEGMVGQPKILPFSTGQNIKSISLMKLQVFKLIYNCLVLMPCTSNEIEEISSESSKKNGLVKMRSIRIESFEIKIQRIFPLEIIKKYLNQNRWNNLAHHYLERIAHLLILRNDDYIKKNIEKDKNNKFSASFLSYLIQNFTKRDFIFLNTVKFTTQGNLHSLYNISKDLAYTLNSTNQLVIFLNEFEPWKKFIINDLKNYQEKTFPCSIKPENAEKSEEQQFSLKVDEMDSIKKLVENISVAKKWPTKLKNKSMSRSGVYKTGNPADLPFERTQTVSTTKKHEKGFLDADDISQLTKKTSDVRQFYIEEQLNSNRQRDSLGQDRKSKYSQI